MWKYKPVKPFPPQVALIMVFHHSHSNPDEDSIEAPGGFLGSFSGVRTSLGFGPVLVLSTVREASASLRHMHSKS